MVFYAMIKATFTLATVYVNCPDCNVGIPEPKSGSYLWAIEDTQKHEALVCTCENGHAFYIPPIKKRTVRG
jgi:hypothetical protein